MKGPVLCDSGENLPFERSFAHRRERGECSIGQFETELSLRALFRKSLLTSKIERVELSRFFSKREEQIVEHEWSSVRHRLSNRRIDHLDWRTGGLFITP